MGGKKEFAESCCSSCIPSMGGEGKHGRHFTVDWQEKGKKEKERTPPRAWEALTLGPKEREERERQALFRRRTKEKEDRSCP